MRETRPKIDPEGIYPVKRTCAELGVCKNTLRRLREQGLITPVNPQNIRRLKYAGSEILACWDKGSRI